jgi:hypothetical protein
LRETIRFGCGVAALSLCGETDLRSPSSDLWFMRFARPPRRSTQLQVADHNLRMFISSNIMNIEAFVGGSHENFIVAP